MRSTVAKPQFSPSRSRRAELSSFIAAPPSAPERRNFSRIATTCPLSRAASSPLPIPSERITHRTPESVLK